MIELIKSRLEQLYKERENLTDTNRAWIAFHHKAQNNGPSRSELLKINQIRIEELENLLKHTDVIRNDKINLILY
jgi:uncharacterized protein YecT (DUF1311 family)